MGKCKDAEDDTTDRKQESFPGGILCAMPLIPTQSICHRLFISWLIGATLHGKKVNNRLQSKSVASQIQSRALKYKAHRLKFNPISEAQTYSSIDLLQ